MRAWAERACSQNDSKARQSDRLAERAHPPGRQVDGRAGHPLHRVPGHAEVARRGPGVGGIHRAGPPDDHVRRHGLEGPGGDQGGVPVRPRAEPGAHPAGDRRRLGGARPPEPLLAAHPLRDPVEPEPHGAAERRIDRHGQKADRVRVFHFVSRATRNARPGVRRPRQRPRSRPGVPDAGRPEGRDDPGRPGQRRASAGRRGGDGDAGAGLQPRPHRHRRAGLRARPQDAQVRAGPGQADPGAPGAVPGDPEGTAALARQRPEGRGGRPRSSPQQPLPDPDQGPRWQAGLPAARPEGQLGGVCRGAGAPAHARRSARSPSTMPWPTGGTTWCSST